MIDEMWLSQGVLGGIVAVLIGVVKRLYSDLQHERDRALTQALADAVERARLSEILERLTRRIETRGSDDSRPN